MIISIASGKGGTGKTTIAVNLALSIANVQFLDCDVEEPNAHIFLKPRIVKQENAHIPVPEIDESLCVYCGRCAEVCAYKALAVLPPQNGRKGAAMVFPQLCHGCGACSALCPQKAIREVPRKIGVVEHGMCGAIEFYHGKLDIGEAMSPPLIRQVKKYIDRAKTVIIDAPPGTSCPVVTAVKNCDYALLVTEPTPFGLNDLVLAVGVLRKLHIPFGVIINRADIGNTETKEYCRREHIPVLMKIPFRREIAVAYSQGTPLVEKLPDYKKDFIGLFNAIQNGRQP